VRGDQGGWGGVGTAVRGGGGGVDRERAHSLKDTTFRRKGKTSTQGDLLAVVPRN